MGNRRKGALVLARALDDVKVFGQAMVDTKARLLLKAD
jgi:hypothetical protein